MQGILVRANKALEEKKRESALLSDQLHETAQSVYALQADIHAHWCYVSPKPAPGG